MGVSDKYTGGRILGCVLHLSAMIFCKRNIQIAVIKQSGSLLRDIVLGRVGRVVACCGYSCD